MIAFRNPYLVKSVNLEFMHVLFQSVNRPEQLASFFDAAAD